MTNSKDSDRPISILIVEDEAVIRLALEQQLIQMGYAIAGSYSYGDEALQAIRENAPDLLLLDIQLGDKLDGISLAEEIARIADVPFIFLSAFSDKSLVKRANEAGCSGYLVKPVEQNSLKATIELALARHSEKTRVSRISDVIDGEISRTTQELYQAIEKLSQLEQTESDFLSRLSTEALLPLQALKMNHRLLQRLDNSGTTNLLTSAALDEITRLELHFNKLLLMFDIIDDKPVDFSPEPIDISNVVSNAFDKFNASTVSRNIAINLSGLSESLTVFTDKSLLSLVLDILVENTLSHCRDGGTVTCMVSRSRQGAVVQFSNEGERIPDEILENISKPFSRFESSTNYVNGLGYDLALASTLTSKTGGQLDIENILGQGSMFRLLINSGGSQI